MRHGGERRVGDGWLRRGGERHVGDGRLRRGGERRGDGVTGGGAVVVASLFPTCCLSLPSLASSKAFYHLHFWPVA